MHTLGAEISVTLDRGADGEECVIDIPAWDFNWQQFYSFPEGDTVFAEPGDRVNLRCAFDNSASNQPTVNGERQTPRDVAWGDGTFDEMCLSYLAVRSTFRGVDGDVCRPTLKACMADCEPGDSE